MRSLIAITAILSFISSAAPAAELCARILKAQPAIQEIEKTFRALAHMKYELDINKVQAPEDTQTRLQESNFNKKQNELMSELNINQKSLQAILKRHIEEIQSKEKGKAKEEEQVRISQEELVNAHWISRTFPMQRSMTHMTNADHGIVFILYADRMTLFDLATGKEEPFDIGDVNSINWHNLTKSGKFLFQVSQTELKIYDIKTKELKPFARTAVQKMFPGNWLIQESHDGKSVLMKNEQNNFLLVDVESQTILKEGRFEQPHFHTFFMPNKDTVIFSTQTESYRYSFSQGKSTLIAPFIIQHFVTLENGGYIYANKKSFYSFDPATGLTKSRTFDKSTTILATEGPNLWIQTYTVNGDKVLSLINAQNLTDVSSEPSQRFAESMGTVVRLDSDTMVISGKNKNFPNGIYNGNDLTLRQELYSGEHMAIAETMELQVSADRKTIVRYGSRADFQTMLEVWTRK